MNLRRIFLWLVISITIFPFHLLAAQHDENMDRAVVRIFNGAYPERYGTGFIVANSPDMIYIVTVDHVTRGNKNCKVEFYNQRGRLVLAEVVDNEGWDKDGLALIAVKGKQNIPLGLNTLSLAPLLPLAKDEEVSVIGHTIQNEWSTLRTIVNSPRGRKLLIGGSIDVGCSGGPLIKEGKVVGIIVNKMEPSSEAIPALSLWLYLRDVAGGVLGDLSSGISPPSTEARRILREQYGIEPGAETFLKIVAEGDIDVLRLFLATNRNYVKLRMDGAFVNEEGDEINSLDIPTGLIFAIGTGQDEAAYELIRAGADISGQESEGRTLLHILAARGQLQLAQAVLEHKGNVNAVDRQGETPLMEAISERHVDVVKLLLDYGADVKIEDNDGNTPLDLVEDDSDEDAVTIKRLLIEKGAVQSLSKAARMGDLKSVQTQIKGGDDVNRSLPGSYEERSTPIQEAVIGEHLAVVQVLLKAGARPAGFFKDLINRKNTKNAVRMHVEDLSDPSAAGLLDSAIQTGNAEIVQLLFTAGMPKSALEAKSSYGLGWVALLRAIECNNAKIVDLLIRQGANVHGTFYEGIPLFWAVRIGNPEIVRLLIGAGADPAAEGIFSSDGPNRKDSEKKRSLWVQLVESKLPENRQIEIEKILWDANLRTSFGYACYGGLSFCVEKWIKSGVDIDAKIDDKTPLMWAALGVRVRVIQILVAAGANQKVVDEKLQSVWDLLAQTEMTPLQRTTIKRILQSGRLQSIP